MRVTVVALCLMLLLLMTAHAVAETAVDIQVAPATIVLKAPCQWVTVHADIAFPSVAPGSVEINGIGVDVVKADDCGNLVAKIAFEKITAIVTPPEALITLTGLTKDGEAFSGSATVRVK